MSDANRMLCSQVIVDMPTGTVLVQTAVTDASEWLPELQAMLEARVAVLAFEAHATLVLDREEMVRVADANGVALLALDAEGR